MAKVSSELLTEAFIKPIRFALLLDDRFPTFSTLTAGGLDSSLDNDRARSLFELCRSRGWLCDVSNQPAVAEKFENDNHLHQSDLLILDYNLDPLDQNDPTAALQIIQKLAASDHFNLVIVYTDSEPRSVTRDIAYSLGAGLQLEASQTKLAEDAIEDLDPDVSRALAEDFSQGIIDDYIVGPKIKDSSKNFRASLQAAGLSGATVLYTLAHWTKGRLERKLKPEVLAKRRVHRPVTTSLATADGPYWVTQDNVFVAVVNKTSIAPGALVDQLQNAIEAWDPNPLMVMMMHARAALEKAGTLADHKVLETTRLRAGWLLRILLGKNETARQANVAELYGRLFERLATSVEPSIVGFGSRLIRPGSGEHAVDAAKALAGADSSLTPSDIYHALNEHLSADDYAEGNMTTGVVFRGTRAGKEKYWVCVTPACDLVPGQNQGGWDGELKPTRPAAVARLNIIKKRDAIAGILQKATIGRHIFLFLNDAPVAFEVSDESSRQLSLETIFLGNGGVIKDGRFSGHVIDLGADGKPIVSELDFEVIAKLRPDYANRLLTQSGSQRARIGVDFFDLPDVPAAAA